MTCWCIIGLGPFFLSLVKCSISNPMGILEYFSATFRMSCIQVSKDVNFKSWDPRFLVQLKIIFQSFLTGVSAPNFLTLTHSIRKKREDIPKIEHKNESSTEDVCRRHSFKLKFGDLGMDWVLFPEAVDVGICRGSCITKDLPSASHNAWIRNLAYEYGLISKQEASCCIPVKYKAENVMYKDLDGLIYSVQMSDLTISECGCV